MVAEEVGNLGCRKLIHWLGALGMLDYGWTVRDAGHQQDWKQINRVTGHRVEYGI